MFFLTFFSLFSLILYLIMFNTNNKSHFFNDGDRILNFKSYNLLNFVTFRALGKISFLKTCSSYISGFKIS